MEMPNLSDGDVISACISKDESSIKKDFPEKATEWIAADGKRCTDVCTAAADSLLTVCIEGKVLRNSIIDYFLLLLGSTSNFLFTLVRS